MDKKVLIKALTEYFGNREWTLINNDKVQLDGTDDIIEISNLNIENLIEKFNNKHQNEARINELKNLLKETDYITLVDYDKKKPDIISQRQLWREEIRYIESLNY